MPAVAESGNASAVRLATLRMRLSKHRYAAKEDGPSYVYPLF